MKVLEIFWKIWYAIFGTILFAPLFAIVLVLDIAETKEKRREDFKELFDYYLKPTNVFTD